MADNENVNNENIDNSEDMNAVDELQNSSLLNNGTVPDYVNFYRGTRSAYEAKKEANQLDPNGMYFTIDEETGKRCIFLGNHKFSDIKSGWEDSIVLSDEGVLQQVSKDSTDYNAHFQQLLEQLNNVPAQEGSTFPYTIEELEIPAEEEAILNEHAKTYRYLMCYDTIQDMRESRYLMVGMTAMVKGGQEVNDGYADFYNIRFRVDGVDVDNGSTLIILDNENVAELIQRNTDAFTATPVTVDISNVIDSSDYSDINLFTGALTVIGGHLCLLRYTFKLKASVDATNETSHSIRGGTIKNSYLPTLPCISMTCRVNSNEYTVDKIYTGRSGIDPQTSEGRIHIVLQGGTVYGLNEVFEVNAMYWK